MMLCGIVDHRFRGGADITHRCGFIQVYAVLYVVDKGDTRAIFVVRFGLRSPGFIIMLSPSTHEGPL